MTVRILLTVGILDSCIILGDKVRGGATVLKVGGGQFCEQSEQKKFFDPPHFLASGGGDKILLR